MDRTNLSPLHRQIARVSRRLFLQTFLKDLLWSWSGALVLVAAWFLAQRTWLPAVPLAWSLAAAGGIVVLGTVLAVFLAIVGAPSRVAAALLFDEKFGLKERVTTSLLLGPDHETTPAGQALLEDVNQRVDRLDVAERFPVRVSWKTALAPAVAALLAVAAFYFEPPTTQAKVNAKEDLSKPPANAAEIEQKIKKLKEKPAEKRAAEQPKSEKFKEIEAELDQIANKPRETKEQLRERIKEMTALEDVMKDREKKLAEKSRALKEQLQQMERLSGQESPQEGPAKDLQKALSEGKLDQAKEEMEKLAKKLKNNELSQKEKEQLAKQLQNIEKKLERASQQKDKEEKLKQLQREGKIDAETLQREMDKLQKENKQSEDLKDIAQKLGKCQKCLRNGDGKGASESLKEAGDKVKDMDLDEQEAKDLNEQLQKLQEAKESCCQGEGQCEGEQDGNGMNAGRKPGGRRPVGEKKPTNQFDARTNAEFDPKGKKIFEGYAPGHSFKKGRTTADMAGEIKEASQEAPDAIEQQRIPKEARDVAKGYFRNLGGQAEADKKK